MSSILDLRPAPSVTAVVRDLRRALEAAASGIAAGSLGSLSESELLAVTVELHGIASQAQALACRRRSRSAAARP